VVIGGIILVAALALWLGRANRSAGSQSVPAPGGPATSFAMVSPTVPAVALALPATPTPVAEAPEATAVSAAPAVPAATAAPIPTDTPLATDTPLPTFTPVPTDTPIPPTFTPVPTDTPTPPTFTPIPPSNPDTGYRPIPLFNAMWEEMGGGDGLLGYPTGPAVTDRNYAKQYFARGFMYWWQSPTQPEPIWVVVMPDPAANNGTTWMRFDNTWDNSRPLFPPNCPEATDPLGPRSGFGIVWCDLPGVKEQVGAPREPEAGSGNVYPKGAVQLFQHGLIFEDPRDRQIWVLIEGNGWRRAGY